MNLKPITIAGGGLAGLTLGIGLRRKGIPVTVWEAGHYPRHRVCGEFISGRGQRVLERFGLVAELVQAGAIFAHSARFFLGKAALRTRSVIPPALCLSRFKLDALLAKKFQEFGGDLRAGKLEKTNGTVEGLVQASGRRLQPVENGWRWFGLKVHARRVELSADLEMYCSPDRYIGVSRIEEGKVNICGLFRRQASAQNSSSGWEEWLRGPPGCSMHRRLERAAFDEGSFCSVAGLPLRPQRAAGRSECCIGDALTMIPPVTGNGMSMAFEAAELAVEPLVAFSQSQIGWEQARAQIACNCDKVFFRRLYWAAWLQKLLFLPSMRGNFGRLTLGSSWLWRLMFAMTR